MGFTPLAGGDVGRRSEGRKEGEKGKMERGASSEPMKEVYYRYPDCLNRKLYALAHLAYAHLTAESYPHPTMPSNTPLL